MEPKSDLQGNVRKYWVAIVLVLILVPLTYTGPHVLLDAPRPEGNIQPPPELSASSDGFLLIILDGMGENILLDEELMPLLNSRRSESATMQLRTGPLTLSATCVSEMMTGVPNSPIDGLKNFNLGHPGGDDGWTLAAKDERYSVGMVGSYVTGNIYKEMDNIDFVNTFKGHADYYEGDLETSEVLSGWMADQEYNVISAHFSGPDKVGHKWGTTDQEYDDKIRDIDTMISTLLDQVPNTWTVVVTADHGMTDSGSHGSAEDITRNVAAFVYGPNIINGSHVYGEQTAIAALLPAVLNLPFPVQLHGRVALDILDLPGEQKDSIEQWNWEAAYNRQVFVDAQSGVESSDISLEKIEWEKISSGNVFSRTSDIALSIVNWIAIAVLSIFAFRPRGQWKASEGILVGLYGLTLASFVTSNALLSYSAMIPRAFGAICAVWLVSWSLAKGKKDSQDDEQDDKIYPPWFSALAGLTFGGFYIWLALTALLWLIFGTLSQAIVVGSLVWALVWSFGSCTGLITRFGSTTHSYTPWLLAFAAFTFGSIRLWFALIPLLFIVVEITFKQIKKDIALSDKIPFIALSGLLIAAVTLVHKRIFDSHLMLGLIDMEWSSSITNAVTSILLLSIAGIIATTNMKQRFDWKASSLFSLWLFCGLIVSALENTNLERLLLVMMVALYILSVMPKKEENRFTPPEGLALAALSMQVLLTWGVWAATCCLILISCVGILWEHLKQNIDLEQVSITSPRTVIALAVLPWTLLILWWTLLGQVNGLQYCFEGICPHPRELSPGALVLKGGYLGAEGSPSTLWMALMVASPVVISSTMMMYELRKRGMFLRPYIASQLLLILGCVSLYAFSPEYPRLVFVLTWNMLFALLQITFALLAVAFFYFFSQPLKSKPRGKKTTEVSNQSLRLLV